MIDSSIYPYGAGQFKLGCHLSLERRVKFTSFQSRGNHDKSFFLYIGLAPMTEKITLPLFKNRIRYDLSNHKTINLALKVGTLLESVLWDIIKLRSEGHRIIRDNQNRLIKRRS